MVQHNNIDHSGVTGVPSLSYASNSNSVAIANAPGASTLVSPADHVHLGVTSVSHASNTFSGPVILTNSGIVGITSPTAGTLNISAAATGTGGGLNDQGTFSYLDASEAAAPGTPAANKARLYAKSDGRFYSKDDAGVEYGPFSSGGALTGERKTWDTAASYPLSADGSEFEFANLTAFNAVWTRRNIADADVWNPPGSQTEIRFDAEGDAIYKSATFSANMWVVLEWSEGDDIDNMFGVAIVNSAGTGMACGIYQGGVYNIAIATWAYPGSFGNVVNPSAADYQQLVNGQHSWLGLERISTNDYRGAYSIDGTTWGGRPAANTPTSFTPAYIGVVRMFTNGVTRWRRIHRINTYTGTFP